VDTGIQQGGIESPLPQTLRSSTRDALSLLMSEEDAETFRNAYGYYIQDDGVLKLRADLTAEERASLEEIVTMPDIVLYMAASQAANGTGLPAQGMAPLSEYPAASSEAAESAASSENTEDTAAETIAPTAADLDAVCAQFAAMAQMPGFSREVKPVIRVADAVDVRRMRQNRADVQQAYHICEQRIAAHNLKMKLVDAEYTLDRSKLVFYFTADNRVDFRELVKDLASQFHTRIELRQIGVRDESKMLGGLGLCGQPFCCSRFLKNFQPVSIKMAKEQGLSLNPAKISGSCGRLMCCLAYEQKSYEYLNSITPQVGSIVRTPDGEGTVIEVNVVAGTLKVRSNVEILAPRIYKRDECVYVRGGKRTPLPADKEDK
jgi:cell fate regulator YaaT (PSP1 superfamily)